MSKKKPFKAVIFDMDGVILDSETISFATWIQAGKENDIQITQDVQKQCMGRNRNDTILILKELYGNAFDSEGFLARTSELFYEEEAKNGIPLMYYAKECLENLRKSYRIALASSTRKESVFRQLKNAGVFDYFETITTGDSVKHSKPDPEIYLKACASLSLPPENCVAIEDSPNGIKSAVKAGLKAIMVPDKILPDEGLKKICYRVCKDLKEVFELLMLS